MAKKSKKNATITPGMKRMFVGLGMVMLAAGTMPKVEQKPADKKAPAKQPEKEITVGDSTTTSSTEQLFGLHSMEMLKSGLFFEEQATVTHGVDKAVTGHSADSTKGVAKSLFGEQQDIFQTDKGYFLHQDTAKRLENEASLENFLKNMDPNPVMIKAKTGTGLKNGR